MKHLKKITFRKFLTILGLFLFVGIVGYIAFDWSNIQIDRYNFEQLEKAKPILESIPATAPKFYTLKEFNEQYKANIQPIENCYYIRIPNGNQKYIFGFQLKSKIYQLLYFSSSYSYYDYNIPYANTCDSAGCIDGARARFINIISNPCKD